MQIYSPTTFNITDIVSDPAYPGQWRVSGTYIEQIAKMTHWEYPEAVERFGRQLEALGIAGELTGRGAVEGDLVMIGIYDFEFSPGMTNVYIPEELLEKDKMYEEQRAVERGMLLDSKYGDDDDRPAWRPFSKGGYMDVDRDEIVEFNENGICWTTILISAPIFCQEMNSINLNSSL